MDALNKVASGEDPDDVYVEMYANSEHETVFEEKFDLEVPVINLRGVFIGLSLVAIGQILLAISILFF